MINNSFTVDIDMILQITQSMLRYGILNKKKIHKINRNIHMSLLDISNFHKVPRPTQCQRMWPESGQRACCSCPVYPKTDSLCHTATIHHSSPIAQARESHDQQLFTDGCQCNHNHSTQWHAIRLLEDLSITCPSEVYRIPCLE